MLSDRRGNQYSTAVHEGIHLYQRREFQDVLGGQWPNEGATEYFTRIVCEAHAIERGYVTYNPVADVITELVTWLDRHGDSGELLLANAYFKGQVDPLLEAMHNHWPNRMEGARHPREWFRNVVAVKGQEGDAIALLAKTDELYEAKKGKELENEIGHDKRLAAVVSNWNGYRSGKVALSKGDVVEYITWLKEEEKVPKDEVLAAIQNAEEVTDVAELRAEIESVYH